MPSLAKEALDALRAIGAPDALRAAPGDAPRVPANTHIHLPPNFSAFETVEQAVDLAQRQGVGLVGLANYYDFEVEGEFAQRARAAGIFPLFGLEILTMQESLRAEGVRTNDPGNPGKTYLCGKAIARFDDMTPRAQQILGGIRRRDGDRMRAMLAALSKACTDRGFPLSMGEEYVVDMIVARHGSPRSTVHLQERHIAMALAEEIARRTKPAERAAVLRDLLGQDPKCDPSDSVALQNELRASLLKAGKPAFVPEGFGGFKESVEFVLELGGIPSYPVLADGANPIPEFEATPAELAANIEALGIHAAEFIPIRNKPDILEEYVRALRAKGLVVTAGTEHNTLDLLPIDPLCVDGSEIPASAADAFWEGACVCAAHQFLVAHGETGYVDAAGRLNPGFADGEERIAAFAKLGAHVIDRYRRAA